MSRLDIQTLLNDSRAGDGEADRQLGKLVYSELRTLAHHALRRSQPDQTMRTTALVNEAFLRLAGPSAPSFDYRGQFFAFAARVMRNVLVDYVREGQASKRGGGVANVTLDEALQVVKESKLDLMMLDEALIRLEEMDVRLSRLVELRFFAGLDIKGVAAELGISVSTATRDWRTARVWLQRELA